MTPYPYQVELATKASAIIRENLIVYLAMEERTGKTLTALLVAEQLKVNKVLIVTKKAALTGWIETLSAFGHTKNYTVINYHSIDKVRGSYDLVILDEAHNYISSAPKKSSMWKSVRQFTVKKPIIYISATPNAQGFYLLYHQFALSDWSPWKQYANYYRWFEEFGIPYCTYLGSRSIDKYDKVVPTVFNAVQHLFVTATRESLGFTHEPEDKVHYINLSDDTKHIYNQLTKERVFNLGGHLLVCDTVAKLRSSLHMLEGGVAKIGETHLTLPNTEKIDYILTTWGDTSDLVIMYNYIAELSKLKAVFKHARLLQATSYAEGVDLSSYAHLVIYSQDWSTARHIQRRARQANKQRATAIVVHFLLVDGAISSQVYNAVSINKRNYIDALYSGALLK